MIKATDISNNDLLTKNVMQYTKSSNDKFWDACFPEGNITSIGDDNSGYVPDFVGEIYPEDVAYYTRWSVSLVLGE